MPPKLDRLKDSLRRSHIVTMEGGGYDYFIHPITDGVPHLSKELLDEVLNAIVEMMCLDCDKIVTAEAMGIPLVIPITQRTGIPTVIIRKRSYGLPGEVEIGQETGYRGTMPMYINGLKEGDRIIFVDDVLSTGGTLIPIMDALKNIGVEVVDVLIVINKHKNIKGIEERIDLHVDQ